jgi:hypothetical protein
MTMTHGLEPAVNWISGLIGAAVDKHAEVFVPSHTRRCIA